MFFLIFIFSFLFCGKIFPQTMKNSDFMQGLVSSVYETPITAYDVAGRIEAQFQSIPEAEKKKADLREQFYQENWERAVIDTIDSQLFREEARRFFIECSSKRENENPSSLPSDTKLQSFFVEYLQHRSQLELSPAKIKRAFHDYIQGCIDQTVWEYRILSLSSSVSEKDLSDLITRISQEKNPDSLVIDQKFSSFCSLSTSYKTQAKSLTADYRKELESLPFHTFSGPIATKQGTFVFLFLEGNTIIPVKSFQEMSEDITVTLLNQNIQVRFTEIIKELRESQEIS